MALPLDPITQRKLILTKQIYEHALNQSGSKNSVTNRIFAVIGFDLAIETLLKAIIGALDKSKLPSEQYNGLLEQCENLLVKEGIPGLPNKAFVLHIHSIRNDTQHKAKYPNEIDVNDCRTYARDFCQEVVGRIWGVSFNDLSLMELIDDDLLRDLLKISFIEIEKKNFKKALSLAESAFFWGSRTIRNFLPSGESKIYEDEFRDSRDFIKKINAVMKNTGDTALFYSVLLSSGITLADYKRFRECTVITHFISETQETPEGVVTNTRAQIHWGTKEPDGQESLWVHNFVVSSILNWQTQGLSPKISDDWIEDAQLLLNWGSNVIIT